jgi:NTE family protein
MNDQLDTGLALSGGGFRATLFHMGALRRLNELGWLRKLDVITGVSGGAIMSGVLARHWSDLQWRDTPLGSVAINLVDVVETPIREFCAKTIDVSAGLLALASPFTTIADQLVAAYDQHLFDGWTLQRLPMFEAGNAPRFVFYATSLQTGVSVRISNKYLADYRIGQIERPDFTLAKVVAASSAFPPVLSPVVFEIPDLSLWKRVPGADQYDNEELKRTLLLGDGGIYDNLGLEAIWQRCKTVLVSDAGAPISVETNPWFDPASQLGRVRDILIEQTRALRKRMLISDFQRGDCGGTYWGITTAIGDYGLGDAMTTDTDATRRQSKVRTRLNRFSPQEQGELINWGYALADAAMRSHVLRGTRRGDASWPDKMYRIDF